MRHVAKLFVHEGGQAVRLPAAFRFAGEEVLIRREATSGDVILSKKPGDWTEFRALLRSTAISDDFLSPEERAQGLTTEP